jgi:hypothetical protein
MATGIWTSNAIHERDYLPAAQILDVTHGFGDKSVLVAGDEVSFNFIGTDPLEGAERAVTR